MKKYVTSGKLLFALFAIALFTGYCKSSGIRKEAAPLASGISGDSVVKIATDAYIFGYPLVLMHETMKTSTNVEKSAWNSVFAPKNQFGHFRSFPDASFKAVVKPNNDTYYSVAWLDLATDAQVLTVPDTKNRYYLLPMLDAYTNVFASIGKRTTGTKADTFLITGPNFKGQVPANMTEVKSPTNMAWIIGRTQVNSAKDGKELVYAIQDGFTLTPLGSWGKSYIPGLNKVDPSISTNPPAFVEKMDITVFFNELNRTMAENPPAKQDSVILRKLAAIGIGAGKEFSLENFDAKTQESLKGLPALIHQRLREAVGKLGSLENSWNVARNELGSYGINYDLRAAVALFGLGANFNADASYPNCQVDVDGNKLNGANKYTIQFEKGQTPPANAFWSLTMYGANELLVENPLNRYVLGDRSPMKYSADGSLVIYIQHDRPSADKVANWLPAPKDAFSVTMRIYWPKESYLNGSWKIPGIVKM